MEKINRMEHILTQYGLGWKTELSEERKSEIDLDIHLYKAHELWKKGGDKESTAKEVEKYILRKLFSHSRYMIVVKDKEKLAGLMTEPKYVREFPSELLTAITIKISGGKGNELKITSLNVTPYAMKKWQLQGKIDNYLEEIEKKQSKQVQIERIFHPDKIYEFYTDFTLDILKQTCEELKQERVLNKMRQEVLECVRNWTKELLQNE